MLDSVLKYLSVITVSGAAISFGVGFWKYLDQRRREERTKRFELFHDLMGRVSAEAGSPGHKLALTQQIAAIYELQHFREYAYASLPILEHLREVFDDTKDPRSSPLLLAIDDTVTALKR
jgi:hypothetical protein